MKVTHLRIYGKVQGIGFRSYVRSHARKLGLIGWVRNLPEGMVEAEVAGADEKIYRLIELCKKGPMLAEVYSIDLDSIEKDFPYEDFVIRKEE